MWIEIIYCGADEQESIVSLPARGVWIEIVSNQGKRELPGHRHSPRGECGLKLAGYAEMVRRLQSLPARGVWIEIDISERKWLRLRGHSPRGECGLKSVLLSLILRDRLCHSPRGECGLKFPIKLRQLIP